MHSGSDQGEPVSVDEEADKIKRSNNQIFILQKVEPTAHAAGLLNKITSDLTVNVTSIGNLYCFLGEILPTMEFGSESQENVTENAIAIPLERPCGKGYNEKAEFYYIETRDYI